MKKVSLVKIEGSSKRADLVRRKSLLMGELKCLVYNDSWNAGELLQTMKNIKRGRGTIGIIHSLVNDHVAWRNKLEMFQFYYVCSFIFDVRLSVGEKKKIISLIIELLDEYIQSDNKQTIEYLDKVLGCLLMQNATIGSADELDQCCLAAIEYLANIQWANMQLAQDIYRTILPRFIACLSPKRENYEYVFSLFEKEMSCHSIVAQILLSEGVSYDVVISYLLRLRQHDFAKFCSFYTELTGKKCRNYFTKAKYELLLMLPEVVSFKNMMVLAHREEEIAVQSFTSDAVMNLYYYSISEQELHAVLDAWKQYLDKDLLRRLIFRTAFFNTRRFGAFLNWLVKQPIDFVIDNDILDIIISELAILLTGGSTTFKRVIEALNKFYRRRNFFKKVLLQSRYSMHEYLARDFAILISLAMIVGSFECCSTVIDKLLLDKHPDIQERVRDGIKYYCKMIIDEHYWYLVKRRAMTTNDYTIKADQTNKFFNKYIRR